LILTFPIGIFQLGVIWIHQIMRLIKICDES